MAVPIPAFIGIAPVRVEIPVRHGDSAVGVQLVVTGGKPKEVLREGDRVAETVVRRQLRCIAFRRVW